LARCGSMQPSPMSEASVCSTSMPRSASASTSGAEDPLPSSVTDMEELRCEHVPQRERAVMERRRGAEREGELVAVHGRLSRHPRSPSTGHRQIACDSQVRCHALSDRCGDICTSATPYQEGRRLLRACRLSSNAGSVLSKALNSSTPMGPFASKSCIEARSTSAGAFFHLFRQRSSSL